MMTTEDVLRLTAAAPFSLDQSARFLRGFAPCADGPVCVGTGPDLTVRSVLEVAGRAVLVTVRQDGPTTLRVTGTGLDGPVAGAVRHWLSLDDPLSEFYALADGDPELAGPVADLHGLHQVRFRSLAEGVVWFTITHRVGQGVALEWKRAIAERYGPVVRDGDAVVHAFPPLADLLAVPEAELVDLLRAPQRVARLRGVLEGVAALGEDWLRSADFGLAKSMLLRIPGVGPFTSDGVLFRVLGRPGPIGVGAPVTAQRRYGDWIGYWSYYRRAARIPRGGRQ
jgi:DNA-3-methyladenine glycosylase II